MIDNLSIFCNKLNMPDPRNTNFEGLDLDSKIKDFVININKSNWIYTQIQPRYAILWSTRIKNITRI